MNITCPKCQSPDPTKNKPQGDCFYVAEEFGHDSEVYDAPVASFHCQNEACKCSFYISDAI